jgi:hypothetical protein
MDSDIELNISFRFSELSDNQADALKDVIPEAGFGTHYKTKKTTGSVPLSEPIIPLLSMFIEKHDIEKDNTDIFISFVSEYDTRIIDVPNYVNLAVVKLGSKITLSYTIA